jgi:hypothetical protein
VFCVARLLLLDFALHHIIVENKRFTPAFFGKDLNTHRRFSTIYGKSKLSDPAPNRSKHKIWYGQKTAFGR